MANARLAFKAYEEFFTGERWEALAAAGANTQRPLWASTGVKNPDYRDTMYVDDLVVANTVNTMPEKTMQAVADHGDINGDQVHPHYDDAQQVMDDLAAAGIEYDDVIATLEQEGVDKFVASWDELVETVVGVAVLSVTTAVAAKQPVRARNEPALTTAAVRRAPRAGCGRRRRGRGAGVWGEVVASMGLTLRLEPGSRRRAAREVAPSSFAVEWSPGGGAP